MSQPGDPGAGPPGDAGAGRSGHPDPGTEAGGSRRLRRLRRLRRSRREHEPAHRGWRHRPHRSWGQRLVLAAGALSTVVLAASSLGLSYLYRKAESIPRIELSGSLDRVETSGSPQNYLIVGIDNDEGLPADDPIRVAREGEQNTDTIMVVRVDPSREHVSILSLPRDLWVPYPDGSNHRINQAFARGGRRPELLIRILNDYLGLRIHHYVQIDFAGFYRLVDAIDGVPVYFPYPARDHRSGLSVPETGCVTLDREQAIGYVRSRHYEQLVPDEDGGEADWESDGLDDRGRVQRQQDFIRRALQRAVSKGARNPGTMNRLLNVGIDSVTIDGDLTPGEILDLGRRFRSFDPNSLENYTLPTVDDTVGAAQILRLVESDAEPILERFRDPGDGEAGDAGEEGEEGGDGQGAGDGGDGAGIQPRSVRLTVLNGTGVPGQATETADALAAAGFSIIGRRDASGDDLGLDRTVVRYPPGHRAQAELVARWLASGAELVEASSDGEVSAEQTAAGIAVITGADWEGVRSTPRSPSRTGTTPSSDATTTTGGEDPGGDGGDEGGDGGGDADSAPPASTTTTTVLPAC